MSKIVLLLGLLTFLGVFVLFSNFAFAVPENPMPITKSDFPESIKIGEKATFSLKISNLEDYRISNIEPIITIMPKNASRFVHVEINPQISTLWDGFYQNTKGTIYVDKGIPADRIFVSVSFMGKNPFGEQVSLSSSSTFNASIKIKQSQNEEILNDSISDQSNEKQGTDYVKYNFSKEERFILPSFIKKNSLPSDIAQSMQDWCTESPISSKKDPLFWDAIPIRILSITSEFQSLQGKTNSFVINSHTAEESCPPNVWMVGTFASENGDKHRFSLFHDGDFFRYQIDEIQCKDDLILLEKLSDSSVVCVSLDTSTSLIERNWGQYLYISGTPHLGKDVLDLINYEISGGTVDKITPDMAATSIIIQISSEKNGEISISLPRIFIDARLGVGPNSIDDTFFVLINGSEVDFEEKHPSKAYRHLVIPFSAGQAEIEIIGTNPRW